MMGGMMIPGSELAGYIKMQHQHMVRSFSYLGVTPHMRIISSNEEVVSKRYIERKLAYGEDIGVRVSHISVDPSEIHAAIEKSNADDDIHGIIVQLPLPASIDTDKVLASVHREKDIDGLGPESTFDAATPTAILWLLSGHNIELASKTVGIVGQGRLVGAPLTRMLQASGQSILVCDKDAGDLKHVMGEADIVVSATGVPRLIGPELAHAHQVIIDAGTASEDGALIGDVDPQLYEREDIKVSPVPGGVGPLTVCALFANLINAFRRQTLEA